MKKLHHRGTECAKKREGWNGGLRWVVPRGDAETRRNAGVQELRNAGVQNREYRTQNSEVKMLRGETLTPRLTLTLLRTPNPEPGTGNCEHPLPAGNFNRVQVNLFQVHRN